MKTCRLVLSLLAAAMLLAAPTQALAKSLVNKSFFGGVAMEGYDPVAYFTLGKPVEGKKEFEVEWKDAAWRFATAEHKALFEKDPERYAPQYGGYCAWAVSQGSTAGIDPDIWAIVDGKLYLNYDAEVQKKWNADREGLIRRADENWPGVLE